MVIWFRFLMREDPPCSEFVRKRKGNNNSVIQSFSHSVIQSFSHSVIQSFSHSVIQSFSHSVIQSFSHSVIQSFSQSFSHSVIQSFSHSVIQSFSHSVIQSFSHSVIQSFSHSVIQSFSHSVIQSFSHSVIQSFLSKHNSFRLVNTQIVNNPFGSTLVTALIVTALIGFSFTAIVSTMMNQQKEGRSIQQQMAVATLKYQVLQTLQNKDSCSCQFTQNIKSQTSEGHLTDFSTLRSSCDSGSEIIIEDGRFLGSGVNVGSIKVSDVSNIPGSSVEYSGKLIVPLKGNLVRAIRPIEIPMYFVSDSSGQIQECGANEGHTAEIREERRRLMADLDTQDQEIKDLTETFNTHKHPHTHPYHRHFTPPPPILASNNRGGGGWSAPSSPPPPTWYQVDTFEHLGFDDSYYNGHVTDTKNSYSKPSNTRGNIWINKGTLERQRDVLQNFVNNVNEYFGDPPFQINWRN